MLKKNENQEQDTPVSSVENAENGQENDLIHQDIQRLKYATSRPKLNGNVQFMLKMVRKYWQKFCLNSQNVQEHPEIGEILRLLVKKNRVVLIGIKFYGGEELNQNRYQPSKKIVKKFEMPRKEN